MENTMMEMNLEQMEQISGGVSPSYFERGKTKEEQIMFVYQNFLLEKQMRLTYEKACELEITKAHKCPYNKLTDEEINNIGLNVY